MASRMVENPKQLTYSARRERRCADLARLALAVVSDFCTLVMRPPSVRRVEPSYGFMAAIVAVTRRPRQIVCLGSPPMSAHYEISRLEDALRRLIEDVLHHQYGDDWLDHSGVTGDRVDRWKERREEASKHAAGAVIEQRLLYYADFPDLQTIFHKNWEAFKPCFADKKELDVYLGRLNEIRNPTAHSRPVLQHEESLAAGMSRELRQKIAVFRNAGGGGPEPEHFCRIEEVSDSFGFRVVGRANGQSFVDTRSEMTLRPGDVVSFRGSAVDPTGRPMRWVVRSPHRAAGQLILLETESSTLEAEWEVTTDDIHEQIEIIFEVTTIVGPHRHGAYDDTAKLLYRVLPNRS